jgi:hypothetical protein
MPSLAALFDASCIAIQPHTCPKCLGPMILTRIRPSRIGFEMRTFQGVIAMRSSFDEVDIFRAASAGLGPACSLSMAVHDSRRVAGEPEADP